MAKYIGKYTGEEIDNCIGNPTPVILTTNTVPTSFIANTYYILGEQSTINIVLADVTQTERMNYYGIDFISGSTPTTLSIPENIKWEGNEEIVIEANKHYTIIINQSNMMAVWGGTNV